MYLRGSEWRRWDLHVHTPATVLNNQFGADWEEYLRAIEEHPSVRVLGITDYMLLGNYSKVKNFKRQGRLANIDLILPNLEFRLAPPNERATAVNIHLLVSPHEPDHEREILRALGRLNWEFKHRRYSCLEDQLVALGRAFDATIDTDRKALEAGVLQFKVDFAEFRKWFKDEHWLRQNSLVAVSAGADGLSGFRTEGAWSAYREEITRFSQLLFSGRQGEIDFWLGRRSPDDVVTMQKLGGPKPCIHGSDAHSLARLLKPEGDRFCWIKADPTFEGLRQLVYEPADRVFIGPTRPAFHDEARVIESVQFLDSNGWFDDISIPLNEGLVSIIGQKGSGKSALAELIAFAAGSWTTDGSGSFLERAQDVLQNLTIRIRWADGATSAGSLAQEQSPENEVRYSQ